MDGIAQMIRGLLRIGGLAGNVITNPKLLIAVVLGIGFLVHRTNSKADEVRQWHKDGITLVGLFSTRLIWWWRAPVAAVIATWWMVAHGLGVVVVFVVVALVGMRFTAPDTWGRVAAAERRFQWAQRWSWRWLWACFRADIIGRERWGAASPYPLAKAVEVRGVNAALTVKIPPRLDLAALARQEGVIGAQLGVLGLRVLPHPTGKMSLARVEVLNKVLAAGRVLPVITAPAFERFLTVGYGFNGPVHWDQDTEVGLGIFGATGSGKGVLARWVALQALDPTNPRELWVIDPQGSAEWSPFEGVPGVRLLRFDPLNARDSLAAIEGALDELVVDVAERQRVADSYGVDGWRFLPDDAKRLYPRRVLIVDEVSTLLAKVGTGDDTRKLRESIGTKLGSAYRTVRKGGVSFIHVDQASYQANETFLAAGAIGQLGRWVALGGMRDETKRMVSGFTDWPWVAPVNGLGLTGRRADVHPDPIEVPDVDRHQVEATLSIWKASAPAEVAR